MKAKNPVPVIHKRNLLGSGSTLLNLACTGRPEGAFLKGKYFYIVGDSASGKTFLSMSCFAEATLNKYFRRYRLIYDNIEDGCLIDLEALFNKQVASRVEAPAYNEDGTPLHSDTVEEFYYNVDDAIEKGVPFIYILDSMDGLSSDAEGSKFQEQKEAHRRGKETAGSYGDGKAKKNSEHLRKVLSGIRATKSILIVLSQTRDNLGFGFKKKTRSGGRALRFYATVEIWTSVVKAIRKTVNGKPRQIGVQVKADVQKNRITGKLHQVTMSIYPTYGIDDTGSMIDYLVDEGAATKRGSRIQISDLDVEEPMARDALIRHIESNSLVEALRAAVWTCWLDVEEAKSLEREKRY